jgi:hypothetical protein
MHLFGMSIISIILSLWLRYHKINPGQDISLVDASVTNYWGVRSTSEKSAMVEVKDLDLSNEQEEFFLYTHNEELNA